MVDILSDKALKISWTRPSRNYGSVTHYYVNISALPGFDSLEVKTALIDADGKDASDKKGPMSLQDQPFLMQIKVSKNRNQSPEGFSFHSQLLQENLAKLQLFHNFLCLITLFIVKLP